MGEVVEVDHSRKVWGNGWGWNTCKVRETFGMNLWKDIRKGWEEFKLRTTIQVNIGT